MSIENLICPQGHKVTDPIQPEFELVRDFMPVLVTSKFDEEIRVLSQSVPKPYANFPPL